MRRRLKKKKRIKVFFSIIVILLIIGAILVDKKVLNLQIKGNKSITVDVFSEYKDDNEIFFLGKNVTNKVMKQGKVDTKKIGMYKVKYTYNYFLIFNKNVTITVKVIDKEAPKIELINGDAIEVHLNNEFKEPGYNVEDNYDKEVKVIITGEVNTKEKGNYYLTYKAKDKSGNTSEVVRKVSVVEVSPTEVNIEDFNINNYFDDNVILKETKDYGDGYLNKIVFIGDSVPWQFGLQGAWDSSNIYAAPCTGPSNIYSQKAYWKNRETTKTIPELIKENHPNYILVSIGFCEIVSSRNPDLFQKNYKKFIEDIKKNSPNTKIILNSMYPVISETLRGNEVPTNKEVNEYNYYVASIAKEYKLKYLDSASVVKAKSGLAEASLTASDGYHPNLTGMKKIVSYVKTHGYEE